MFSFAKNENLQFLAIMSEIENFQNWTGSECCKDEIFQNETG